MIDNHNHELTNASAHSVLCRLIVSVDIREEINCQLAIQIVSFQVLFFIRYDNSFEKDVMIFQRDVYNLVVQQRREKLNSLILIQTLVRELNEDDWIFVYQKNIKDQIIHLFFARRSSQNVLQKNHEVLIMNCIYKTNRFKLSLLMISDQTILHSIFYVVFVFLVKKKIIDYI